MIPIRKKISNVSNIGDGTVDNDEFNKLDNVSGDLVGTTGTQTLTNKDLSSVTNTFPSANSSTLVQAQFGASVSALSRYLRRAEVAFGGSIDSAGAPAYGRPDAAWVIPYDCTLVECGWQQDTTDVHDIRIHKTVGTELDSFSTGAYNGTEPLNIPLLADDWIYVQIVSNLPDPVRFMVTIYAQVDTPIP
jgi:hypothetical protein